MMTIMLSKHLTYYEGNKRIMIVHLFRFLLKFLLDRKVGEKHWCFISGNIIYDCTFVVNDVILCTLNILLQDKNNPCRKVHFNVNL